MRSLLSELSRTRRPSAKPPRTFRPACEALEDRLAPSCTVALNNMTGEVLVSGDNASDAVAISRVSSLGTDYVRVVADGAPYQFREADVRSIRVLAGGGADSVQLDATHRPVTIDAGDGDDAIRVGSTSLADITAPVTVSGGAGTDSLTFADQGALTGQQYTLTATSLARTGMSTVSFGGVERLALSTGAGNDQVRVQGTSALNTVLSTGAGDDTLTLGSPGHTLDGIANVAWDAGSGNDLLIADDSGHLAPRTYQVAPDGLTLANRPAPVVTFSGVEAFRLYTAQSATVVDNHGTGYTFQQFQGPPAPSGATAASAPAPGATDAMLPALTPSSAPPAAGQPPTADVYWLALAQDPLARPGLV
jgi:hypothetical protein